MHKNVGVGKSSLVSLLFTAVSGSRFLQVVSDTRPSAASSQITTHYRVIRLPGMPFELHDVMGINLSDPLHKLFNLFGPFLDGQVIPNTDLTGNLTTSLPNPNLKRTIRDQDKQAAVIIVMSVGLLENTAFMDLCKQMVLKAKENMTMITVALVRCDEEEGVSAADPLSVFCSDHINEVREKIARVLEIPEHAVFPILAPLTATVSNVHRRMALDLLAYIAANAYYHVSKRVPGCRPRTTVAV